MKLKLKLFWSQSFNKKEANGRNKIGESTSTALPTDTFYIPQTKYQEILCVFWSYRSRFKITKPRDIPLTLSCIILQNGQTFFKNLAVWTPQDFWSMFGHFTTLCVEGLTHSSLICFEKLALKKNKTKNVTLNGHISKSRANSESRQRFY